MHLLPKRSGRLAGPLVAAAAWSVLGIAGCDQNGMATDMSNPGVDMAMNTQPPGPPTKAASVALVSRPLAAVLSPDGQTVYFTAHDANALAQLYSVPAAGGTPALITTTSPLIHPLSMDISPNGATLFIVDGAGGPQDAGAIYASSIGGALGANAVTGVRGPAGIAVSADGTTVYISGFDATDGQPGLFSTGATGGGVTVVAKGAPFNNPSAVTITADGTLYVVDTTARGAKQGAVIKVAAGAGTLFTAQALTVGFSAGISPNGVGSNDLLVTGNTGLGSGVIYNVSTAGAAAPITLGTTALFDPATIHRAANVSAWVAVDSVNAMQTNPALQQGSIYLLTP